MDLHKLVEGEFPHVPSGWWGPKSGLDGWLQKHGMCWGGKKGESEETSTPAFHWLYGVFVKLSCSRVMFSLVYLFE